MNATDMNHHRSIEWAFALDIPKNWNAIPTVPANSPYEVKRFVSREDGDHLLIIFREPHDPKQSLKVRVDEYRQALTTAGFGNFAGAETTIGPKGAIILDFDKPQGDGTWSCRSYVLLEDSLKYTLGFGTTDKSGMFDLYDRIAKSFEILPDSRS